MSKQKAHSKDKKKSSQLVIRVEKAERDAFVTLCDRLDTSAAREIRRFMRELVAAHSVEEATDSDMPPGAEAIDGEFTSAESDPAEVNAETDAVSGGASVGEAEKQKKKQKRAV